MEKSFYDVFIKIVNIKTGKCSRTCYINHIQADSEEEASKYAIDKMTTWSDFDIFYPDRSKIKIVTQTTKCSKIHLSKTN